MTRQASCVVVALPKRLLFSPRNTKVLIMTITVLSKIILLHARKIFLQRYGAFCSVQHIHFQDGGRNYLRLLRWRIYDWCNWMAAGMLLLLIQFFSELRGKKKDA
jgi:hypothetical protein